MDSRNHVASLNEYAQRRRLPLSYDFLGSDGPDHNKTFTMRAVIGGNLYPNGVGKTKKDAKQDAAKNALTHLLENGNQDPVEPSVNAAEASAAAAHQTTPRSINYISWLNEYGQKNRVDVRAVESAGVGANQCCHYVVDDKTYPSATGATKREAKERAAKLAHDEIGSSENTQSPTSSTVPKDDGASPMLSARSAARTLNESSPQSTSGSTSDSIVFAHSSNSSGAQTSSGFSEVGASSRMQRYPNISGVGTASPSPSMEEDVNQKKKNETSSSRSFTADFDTIQNISSGAYGCVFKAREKLLEKDCAVKIVLHLKKSLQEVLTLSELLHPNVVRYFTCWTEDSGYQWEDLVGRDSSFLSSNNSKFLYIQMELCDTKTLKDWIQEKNTESLTDLKRGEQSLHIAEQIFSGVEYIHLKKKIHRDLKPANILFGLEGQVKIGDFGLVTGDDTLNKTTYVGTPNYMAPEQKTGRTYDRKVDIYALGLVFLELLWKLPTGHEKVEVFEKAKRQEFPPEFARRFFSEVQIIKSMLSKEPKERPEASAVRAKLKRRAERRQQDMTV
ncbi:interferon-induced, double-stranded RNA-activated protein kinase-like isoform X3 [Labrus mixtus]|uniref:interferon-induced, double-stranded RNA-activated protein kinase-like isoform X3 n=1 Tax=Labrus mixtus TaxID=508554 RepID=UPI0029BFAFAB|nr:interferon-induced, double-stranded RNA-activated protein kinase-like isoform X3 [Labrus mixtus]